MRGVVPENDLNIQAAPNPRRYVVDSVIGGLKAAGTKDAFDKAEALTKRFYGSVCSEVRYLRRDLCAGVRQREKPGDQRNRRPRRDADPARRHLRSMPSRARTSTTRKADNQAVGKRIIDDLSAKSGGDPARIAVGYFSGPGNIALPEARRLGRQDKADPTGKTVSSYVADVTKRLNGQQPASLRLPILNARYTSISRSIRPAPRRWRQLRMRIQRTSSRARSSTPMPALERCRRVPPSRANPYLGEDTRNSLLAKYDSAASDVIKLQAAMKKFTDPNGGDFNPFDKDEKKNVDRIFNSLGGDMKALEIVTNRTGMVPEAAVTALRGAGFADPQKVEQALQVSANLVGGKFPDVFANVKGGEDLTKTANTFRHYVYDRGMTAADATKDHRRADAGI
jgi:hypothetical protein